MGLVKTPITVYLKNGLALNTVGEFGEDVDPVESLLDEIEDREVGSFKQIGHLTIDFRDIAGFAID